MQTYFLNDFKVNIPKYILPGTDEYLDPANVDFEVRLFVPPSAGAFVASHIGGKYVNCKVADGQICIIADGHKLAPGEVWYEAKYHLPDSDYPDGYCTLVEKSSLGLSLTTSADVEVREEQEASVAEQLREKNESDRQTAETARQTAEAQRIAAETARQTAEQSREQAEATRVAAESQRAETFAGWREAIEGSGSATSPTYSFDAQWTAAGGTVITPGKVYECNGTDDLTFAEAVEILSRYSKRKTNNYSAMFFASTSRALLPIWIPNAVYVDFSQAFDSAAKLRKIVFKSNTENCLVKLSAKGTFRMCGNASRLEEIEGRLDVAQVSGGMNDTFPYCSNLREVRIYRLVCNISFAHSPLLSLASLQYLVENAANGDKAITLTVHADVFAKLTDESNTEWHAVAVAALAKNITIATT